jgi:hypothetical protein
MSDHQLLYTTPHHPPTLPHHNSITDFATITPLSIPLPPADYHQPITQNNWVWSSDVIDCHMGDTVTFTWSTNENIIEADSMFNPMSNPSFSSGTLSLGGSYSHVFTAPGTYYFMSQVNDKILFQMSLYIHARTMPL